MNDAPLLELRRIEKSFPGVHALKNMSFSVRRGSVHVICGENGAGKSTLMKIINGIYQPDSGSILFEGQEVVISNPTVAKTYKIYMISQELNYIPEMTVEESLFLGQEPLNRFGGIDWKEIRKRTITLLKQENLPYRPETKLKDLSVSDIQMLEIMKAVSQDASILIMDEPTSAITTKEVDVLFRKIDQLRSKGVGIVYISHRFDELFRIADDITVIRDGAWVDTRPASQLNIETIIQLMVGRVLDNVYPPRPQKAVGETILSVEGLSDGDRFHNITFNLKAGEILGFSGLMGAGRTEVMRAIFGLAPYLAGTIRIRGKEVKISSVKDAIAHKIAMLSEDRKRYGIIQYRDIKENAGLSSLEKFIKGGFRNARKERELISSVCGRMRVKAPTLETSIDALSGGNQQKVVFAKWMLREPDILILDEPTRGIDVGAKYEIYKIMMELAAEGKAVIMISSELPEIIGVCDRVYVMADGHITGELPHELFTQERIMKYATMAEIA
ncbi:sugar ABC transporter ATP-binding protein [Rhizobium sp. AG207R]|uniref:sugar ABC transporter ATP-binding protein n=1 Tax=Rhizobium sp. AG207R TaxID=2802287 RepID=UPI0022ABDB59|nr:sugar ABC transporter ATP-binding protein [Rhizobium sp. AG207R]MCZ3378145.1 sugar ABC transporter ATP-binding protein [Rhizobium sp. AG207R]